MTGQPAADTEAIRALVREVLADLLPAAAPDPGKPYGTGGSDLAGPSWVPVQEGLPHTVREHVESVEVVSIRTDADLGNFVLHLLHLFENPKHRDALRAGRLRFRLAAPVAGRPAPPPHPTEEGAGLGRCGLVPGQGAADRRAHHRLDRRAGRHERCRGYGQEERKGRWRITR